MVDPTPSRDPTPKPVIHRIAEYMAAATVIASTLAAIGGVVWLVAKDYITPIIIDLSGVSVIAAEVREGFNVTGSQLRMLSEQVEDNSEELRALNPQTIAEYDELRSRIFSPCVRGERCEVQYRVRRTVIGKPCGAPFVVARTVVDVSGQFHTAQGLENKNPRRLSGEWSMVFPAFETPERAPLGLAEFYLTLAYECPQQKAVEEESIHLVFEITDVKGAGP